MSQAITEVMTPDPVTVAATATVAEAARLMRDENIGNVVVTEDYQVCGFLAGLISHRKPLADFLQTKPSLPLFMVFTTVLPSSALVHGSPTFTVEMALGEMALGACVDAQAVAFPRPNPIPLPAMPKASTAGASLFSTFAAICLSPFWMALMVLPYVTHAPSGESPV